MTYAYTVHDGKRITMTADQVGVAEDAPEWARQQWNITLRHGRKRMTFPYYGGGMASDPSAEDVIEDMLGNASTLTYSCFHEWAADYGYDADSRSAEQTYRACRRLGERFARFLA